MEIFKKHIELERGEIIKEGDFYLDHYIMKLFPSKCVGLKVGTKNKTEKRYFRPKGRI